MCFLKLVIWSDWALLRDFPRGLVGLEGNTKDDVTLSSGWMGGSAQMANRSPPSLTTSSLLTMFLWVVN